MARYPVSVARGKVSERFQEILNLHFAPGSRILDPTCGEKLLWKEVDDSQYDVTFSDLLPKDERTISQDLFLLPQNHPGWFGSFDGVVYDPPYFFGVPWFDDPRAETYKGYGQTKEDLFRFMRAPDSVFSQLLRSQGKIIIKCSDQYLVSEKKLYLLRYLWLNALTPRYDVVDFYIYHHPRVSPTAFQVKNRGSCVIVHTYFIVGRLRDREEVT